MQKIEAELIIGQRFEVDPDGRKHRPFTWTLLRPGEPPVHGGRTIGGPHLTTAWEAIEEGARWAVEHGRRGPEYTDDWVEGLR